MTKPWSDAQQTLLQKLIVKAGFGSWQDAWAGALPDYPAPAADPDMPQASMLISALEAKVKPPAGDASAAAPRSGARYLTARHLRQIDTGTAEPPAELDDDARWVLSRLARWRAVESIADSRSAHAPAPAAVNGEQPIQMDQLLAYFKSWDALAEAFGVSVPTAKAWGTYLPVPRGFEAEIKTRGHVRVPSAQRG
jgi:hypothetical protein